jgi:hypothetical protein
VLLLPAANLQTASKTNEYECKEGERIIYLVRRQKQRRQHNTTEMNIMAIQLTSTITIPAAVHCLPSRWKWIAAVFFCYSNSAGLGGVRWRERM